MNTTVSILVTLLKSKECEKKRKPILKQGFQSFLTCTAFDSVLRTNDCLPPFELTV